MEFAITNLQEADNALEYFNYFHDSIVKKFELISHDCFNKEKNQICIGVSDIIISFSHFNYQEGSRPFNQVVRISFKNITDLTLKLHEIKPGDWAVDCVEINKINGKNNSALQLAITFNFLDKEKKEWLRLKNLAFSFEKAVVQEK